MLFRGLSARFSPRAKKTTPQSKPIHLRSVLDEDQDGVDITNDPVCILMAWSHIRVGPQDGRV